MLSYFQWCIFRDWRYCWACTNTVDTKCDGANRLQGQRNTNRPILTRICNKTRITTGIIDFGNIIIWYGVCRFLGNCGFFTVMYCNTISLMSFLDSILKSSCCSKRCFDVNVKLAVTKLATTCDWFLLVVSSPKVTNCAELATFWLRSFCLICPTTAFWFPYYKTLYLVNTHINVCIYYNYSGWYHLKTCLLLWIGKSPVKCWAGTVYLQSIIIGWTLIHCYLITKIKELLRIILTVLLGD